MILPSSQSYIELFMSLRMIKEYDLLDECWNGYMTTIQKWHQNGNNNKMLIEGYYVYLNALCESGYNGKKRAIGIVTSNTYNDYLHHSNNKDSVNTTTTTSNINKSNNNNNIYPFNIILNSCSYNEKDRYNENNNVSAQFIYLFMELNPFYHMFLLFTVYII